MAIIIEAKNISIEIKENFNAYINGKSNKTAKKINLEATDDDLLLSSIKQIITLGNKKGK